jgi:hypothetical protein
VCKLSCYIIHISSIIISGSIDSDIIIKMSSSRSLTYINDADSSSMSNRRNPAHLRIRLLMLVNYGFAFSHSWKGSSKRNLTRCGPCARECNENLIYFNAVDDFSILSLPSFYPKNTMPPTSRIITMFIISLLYTTF